MGRKGNRELAKVEQLVRDHIEAGHRAFIVPIYCMADGIANYKIERMREAGQELLLNMGLDVTGMRYDEWKYTAHYEVRVPERSVRVAATADEEEEDPALAQLHRSLAMANAHPEGDVGKTLSADQIAGESRRMRESFASGDLWAIWNRRLELGYGLSPEGVSQTDWFWVNAAPAIAALRLGQRDHPVVAMCCGYADQGLNRNDPEQVAASAEFNRLFFV